MKQISRFLIPILVFAALISCEKDGDLITLSGLDESELLATETQVILTQESSSEIALSLTWSTSTLTVSDSSVSAPDILETILQTSTTEDFSANVIESYETSLSHTYLGGELNTLAKDLGLSASQATPVYFRLKASVGKNTDPVYSKYITVAVTPYEIDMSLAFILDVDKLATAMTLYSAASDGEYLGFMGVTGWQGYFLKEGDGAVWGNDPISGTPFIISSVSDSWNCWFPELGGCYYVDFNTNNEVWSALSIPSLTVSGEVTGEMTFDRPNMKWILLFTATSTSMTININGAGQLYDNSTGDAASVAASVAFAQNGEQLVLADIAGDMTIAVPALGDYTLTVDLSDPKAWTIDAIQGSEIPETVYTELFLPGATEGDGDWSFDHSIPLYNEDALSYAGVIDIHSAWGYAIHVEKDNWEDKYTFASGDAYSGTLDYKGITNLPAPDSGLYLVDVSLVDSTYSLTSIDDTVFISGLNDVWDFSVSLIATGTPSEYSGPITISSVAEWGFQVHLDRSWNHYYGGDTGSLSYEGGNITDDASLALGTYTMTVNLTEASYSIVP
ncbi:MAG: DUF5114 domain-containing protein [Bacteroidales bacterium]|jgi:hypothetical protein|nr:DUF5114 domain-containing protein [Bacteroidales bacterium]